MPLHNSRSGGGPGGPVIVFPVRESSGRVLGFAHGARARSVPVAARSGARVAPQPFSRGRAGPSLPVAPAGVQAARSAPSVVRISELRARVAADRLAPAAAGAAELDRSCAPRHQVVDVTYSVRLPAVASSPAPQADARAGCEAVGAQMASTAARIGVAAAGAAAAQPVQTRASLEKAAERGEMISQKQMQHSG